jgi:hypothetical protein
MFGQAIAHLQETADEALFANEDGSPNMLGRLANWARQQASAADAVPRSMVGEERVAQGERRDAILDRPLAEIAQQAEGIVEQFDEAGLAPMSYDEVQGIGTALKFASENLSASLPYMLSLVASGRASPILAVVLASGEVNDEVAELLPDMPVEERMRLALPAGMAMASLELFGLSHAFGVLSPGNVVKEAVQGKLVDTLVANGVSRAAGRLLQAGIVEGTTEVLQEGIIMTAVSAGGGEYTEQEIRHRLTQAFFAGGAAGGGLRGGVETAKGLRDVGRWIASGKTKETLDLAAEAAGQSKLRGRSPEVFQSALEAQGLGEATVQVPANVIDALYQSSVPGEVLVKLGVSEGDFEAALVGGGDVSVPVANHAAHFAGTEVGDLIAEHGALSDTEMSAADARAFQEGLAADVAADVEASIRAELDPTIEEAVATQIAAAQPKISQRDAAIAASAHTMFWNAAGSKYGVSPDEFASRFGFEVRGARDDPPSGAITATPSAAEGEPAANPPPLTSDQILEQSGAREITIDVEMDDGTVEPMEAGVVIDALDQRISDANSLLRCLRG